MECPGEDKAWALSSATQCLKNSAEGGERSVLTLGSHVPSAYTAMCGEKMIFYIKN